MTTTEIRLVEESFEQVRPVSSLATHLFMTRLFEIDPEVGGLVPEPDVTTVRTLSAMIRSLRRKEQFTPLMAEIRRRLSGIGLRDQDYVAAGAALLWTLERGLGAAFTDDVRDAWASVYSHVASAVRAQ